MKTKARPASALGSALLAGLVVFCARMLLVDFENDHFMHLAWAQQIALGELPVRDFFEPGFILQTLASYLALQASDGTLLGEALLTSGMVGLAATCVMLLTERLTGSRRAAILATVLAALTFPRLYAYPKVVGYVAAALVGAHYTASPTRRTLLAAVATTVLAFGLRHDHGVYLGAYFVTVLVVSHLGQPAVAIRAAAVYGASCAVLLMPWLLWILATGMDGQYQSFLQAQGQGVMGALAPVRLFPRFDPAGLTPVAELAALPTVRVHVRWADALPDADRSQLERQWGLHQQEPVADRTWVYALDRVDTATLSALVADSRVEDTAGIDRGTLRAPAALPAWVWDRLQRWVPVFRIRVLPRLLAGSNAAVWLHYVCLAVPWIALALAGSGAWRPLADPVRIRWLTLLPMAALSTGSYLLLVRGSIDSRIGDVAPLPMVLGAFACAGLWRLNAPRARPVLRLLTALFVGVTLAAAWSYGQVGTRLSRAGLPDPFALTRRAHDVFTNLTRRPLDVRVPPGTTGSALVSRYLNVCTAPSQRVGLIGFEPDVLFYAERGFAGGQEFFHQGWHTSPGEQAVVQVRLARQDVPLVVAFASEWPRFEGQYPEIRRWLLSRYDPHPASFGGPKPLTIWVRHGLRPTGEIVVGDLRCFK